MSTLIPVRRRPPASTVCLVCGAIHPTTSVHDCTQETEEGEPMLDHPDKITTETALTLPGDKRGAQAVRLACIRAAAETGMPVDNILPTARQWAAFALGTDQLINQHITR